MGAAYAAPYVGRMTDAGKNVRRRCASGGALLLLPALTSWAAGPLPAALPPHARLAASQPHARLTALPSACPARLLPPFVAGN